MLNKISENGFSCKDYFHPNIRIGNDLFDRFHFMNYLSRRIKKEMDKKGLKQDALAKDAKVGQATINRILNGKADPRLGTLKKIAKKLDIPVEYLTTEDETKALLFLEISRMNKEEVHETLSHIEKEKLYKEAKKVSQ